MFACQADPWHPPEWAKPASRRAGPGRIPLAKAGPVKKQAT
jgi:hypothetical protein